MLGLAVAAAVSAASLVASSAHAQTCYIQPLPNVSTPWGFYPSGAPHRGTDYVAPAGTGIPAIADAQVWDIVYGHPCMGNIVILAHPDGLYSSYSHLLAVEVSVGQTLARGQRFATVGNTGSPMCTTGPHVHVVLSDRPRAYYDAPAPTLDPYAYIEAHPCTATPPPLLLEQPVAYAPPNTTDINGDGRSDLCARAGDGVHCYLSTGTGWDETDVVLPWSDANSWGDVTNYATFRMGDVNGDGLADFCGRSDADFLCALSTGSALGETQVWKAGLSDGNGWNQPQYYTTLRLADVNGDGREDLCGRHSAGFSCWLSDGESFVQQIEGPRWSDGAGFTREEYFGTLRMGDLDGDGRADVCIRGGSGMGCALSDGAGFPTEFAGPGWSDASGFNAPAYWSTLRMADVNGDGMDDLCIRTSTDLRCALSVGTGFGETLIVGALSDANAWNDPTNYRTLRVGDLDGDGAADLCARGDGGIGCWLWNGSEFVQRAGPGWSDAANWGSAPYFETIRMTDIDGDGRSEICARGSAGLDCYPTEGDGFGAAISSAILTDANGWHTSPAYWSTIITGGRCRPEAETCNERDDDCDGVIDEDTCIPVMSDAGGGDASAGSDAGPGRMDAGSDAATDTDPPLTSECGCRAAGTGDSTGALSWILLGALIFARRRR